MRAIFGVVASALNVVLAALEIFAHERISILKWSIYREVVILLFVFRYPAQVMLEGWLAGFRLVSKFSWSSAIVASVQDMLLMLCSFISTILLLVLFPEIDHQDYHSHPWAFGAAHSFLLGTILLGMKLIGTILTNVALYKYGQDRIGPRVSRLLQDAASIIIIVNALNTWNNPEKIKGHPRYRKRLSQWASTKSQLLARDRVRRVARALRSMDKNLLTDRLWAMYSEVRAMDPTIQWSDFADALIAGGVAVSKLSLLNASIQSSDDLRSRIEELAEEVEAFSREISEHDRLFNQLRACFNIVSVVILVIVILPMIGFSPNAWLLPLGVSITPSLVALTVIFGFTVATVIEAIVFTFYRHPFDVGDEIRIENVYFVVKRIGILFVTMENALCIRAYYPTSVLMQKNIMNLTRSARNRQQILISLSKLTSAETVERIRRGVLEAIHKIIPQQQCTCTIHDFTQGVCTLCILIDHSAAQRPMTTLKQKSMLLDAVLRELQSSAEPFLTELTAISL